MVQEIEHLRLDRDQLRPAPQFAPGGVEHKALKPILQGVLLPGFTAG